MSYRIHLGLSICLSLLCLWSTAPRLLAEPQLNLDEKLSLTLDGADVRELLASVGQLLGVAAEIHPAVTGTISLEMNSVSVEEILNAACEVAGCSWTIVVSEETVLRVSATHGDYAESISMHLVDADIREVLSSFAHIFDAGTVHIAPELTGTVSIKLTEAPLGEVLDVLCERVGCTWILEPTIPPRLVVTAEGEPSGGDFGRIELSSRGAALVPDRSPALLGVRLSVPGEQDKEQILRFTWNQPVVAVKSGENSGWQARLAWVPLGTNTRAILPIIAYCGPGEQSLHYPLDPVVLPLTEPWNRTVGGASLALFDAAEQGERALSQEPTGCLLERPIEVTFLREHGPHGTSILHSPGHYVQIVASPTVDEPASHFKIAVVLLGREGDGARVALLTEDGDGGVVMEEGWVGPDTAWHTSVNSDQPIKLEARLARAEYRLRTTDP